MLTVRNLCKRFGASQDARALFAGLELEVAAGEFIAITGESGSGKSTLLNLIAGLDSPDAGTIQIDGTELTRLSDGEQSAFRRTHLGFVFQAFHLLPYLSVADNVGLPLVISGGNPRERRPRVEQALADVGLAARAQSQPRELSGGEMQRVAIARALVHRPKLILADEPTGNLDPANAAQVLALLRERVDRSRTACILVTHSSSAARIAQRRYVLDSDGLHLA
ncbi:MAG: ABC transporter ATP-binding protein [Betaproteobacteria bacterium]|nr:MAG: ABC transporter ATP-binding protein [Betaproteobacteria bacterium]